VPGLSVPCREGADVADARLVAVERATVRLMAGMSLVREVRVVVLEEPRRLYRVCGARDSDGFLDALRSHYELRRPPRGPENRAAAIHMALSMFDAPAVARDAAVRVPKLGGHVATLPAAGPRDLRREDGRSGALVGLGQAGATG
jgi:hypothetical protein